jgi:hypothetical protein
MDLAGQPCGEPITRAHRFDSREQRVPSGEAKAANVELGQPVSAHFPHFELGAGQRMDPSHKGLRDRRGDRWLTERNEQDHDEPGESSKAPTSHRTHRGREGFARPVGRSSRDGRYPWSRQRPSERPSEGKRMIRFSIAP